MNLLEKRKVKITNPTLNKATVIVKIIEVFILTIEFFNTFSELLIMMTKLN